LRFSLLPSSRVVASKTAAASVTIFSKCCSNNINFSNVSVSYSRSQQQYYYNNFTPIIQSTKRFKSSKATKEEFLKAEAEREMPTVTNNTTTTNSTSAKSTSTQTTASSSSSTATATPGVLQENIQVQISQFRRFVHTWQLGILGGIGLCMGIGSMLWLFWQPFRSDATLKSTDLASDVLSDARVREGAVQVTKEVVENVLRDPSSVDLLVGVLTRLLQQEGTKLATIIFLEELFNDPLTQDLARRLIIDVARDEWTKESLSDVARVLVLNLLKEQIVKKALTDLLLRSATDALRNEELQRTTSQSVRKTVAGVVMPWS
jgi:hypothetical protein